jgi:hypothetical protein
MARLRCVSPFVMQGRCCRRHTYSISTHSERRYWRQKVCCLLCWLRWHCRRCWCGPTRPSALCCQIIRHRQAMHCSATYFFFRTSTSHTVAASEITASPAGEAILYLIYISSSLCDRRHAHVLWLLPAGRVPRCTNSTAHANCSPLQAQAAICGVLYNDQVCCRRHVVVPAHGCWQRCCGTTPQIDDIYSDT